MDGRGPRKRPGMAGGIVSRAGCLIKQSTDCDPREKGDRRKVKEGGREEGRMGEERRAGWHETISLACSARRL